MSDFFLKLINMSFAASWLIVAVIILRLIARKTPRWIICLLWGLVAIRLICPFSLESPLSMVPSEEIIPYSILDASMLTFADTAGMKLMDETVNEYLDGTYFEGVSAPANYGINVMAVISSIWLCGLSIIILYAVIMHLRLRSHLKEAVLLRDRIYICDHVRVPFVFGFFYPHIYLPSGISEADMEYVIAHEKAHLRRRDHIWKVIAFLLLGIYWFNPLSWIAFSLFCKDIELACDEKVIKNMNMPEKKAYTESLLSYSFKKRIAIVSILAFGEVGIKQRVKSILNYKKPTFWVMFFSILACIVIGTCFLTTSPQEHQIQTMILEDTSSAQIDTHRKENELRQLLLDYDKDNIVKADVYIGTSDNENTYTNILVVSKDEITDTDDQDKIMDLVSAYLDLDAYNINLICMDSETFSRLSNY